MLKFNILPFGMSAYESCMGAHSEASPQLSWESPQTTPPAFFFFDPEFTLNIRRRKIKKERNVKQQMNIT